MNTAVLIISIITLLFVAYQVYLNKKTLDATDKSLAITKENIENEQKLRTIQHLHDINKSYWVNAFLQTSISTLNRLILDLQYINESHDEDKAKNIYYRYNKLPRDIIDQNLLLLLPEWLKQIYLTCASYYYNGTIYSISIWDAYNEEFHFELINIIISTVSEDINSINKLSEYILDFIPEVFSECPYYDF